MMRKDQNKLTNFDDVKLLIRVTFIRKTKASQYRADMLALKTSSYSTNFRRREMLPLFTSGVVILSAFFKSADDSSEYNAFN